MVLKTFSVACLVIRSFSIMKHFGSAISLSLYTSPEKDKPLKKRMELRDSFHTETLCKLLFYDEVSSTMDKAKEVLKQRFDLDIFAVITREQTFGRGTRGRSWISTPGNVMMTIAFKISDIQIPITLIPLRVGTILADTIESEIFTQGGNYIKENSAVKVQLKWPNDVLINAEKVCGVLIEIEGDHVLVGIGCNVVSAPSVELTTAQSGRPATSIVQHIRQTCSLDSPPRDDCPSASVPPSNIDINSTYSMQAANNMEPTVSACLSEEELDRLYVTFAERIAGSFGRWVRSHDSAGDVVRDFSARMTRDSMRLRDVSAESTLDGNEVIPLWINDDGTLEVEFVRTGNQKTLVADYLY